MQREPITTLMDLLDIMVDAGFFRNDLIKINEGSYVLGKLYIYEDRISYKCDSWELAPGVFSRFKTLTEIIK